MTSNIISIIKGSCIELYIDNTDQKIKVKKKSVKILNQLIAVKDWEWYYLSLYVKKGAPELAREDIINIIIATKLEKNIVISEEQARKLTFEDPYIGKLFIYNTKKIQKWYKYYKKVKAANYIKNWWLHYYYKPSSKLGIEKASKRFKTIKSLRDMKILI